MLTTSNPRLWFTLIGLFMAFICLGGSCLGIAAMVGGDETSYLLAVDRAGRWKLAPFPEQTFLWRREEATDEQWKALAQATQIKAKAWDAACQEVKQAKAPERLVPAGSAIEAARPQVTALFEEFRTTVDQKDREESRRALTLIRRRLRALEKEIEGILQRIYQPDSIMETEPGTDPARPPGV